MHRYKKKMHLDHQNQPLSLKCIFITRMNHYRAQEWTFITRMHHYHKNAPLSQYCIIIPALCLTKHWHVRVDMICTWEAHYSLFSGETRLILKVVRELYPPLARYWCRRKRVSNTENKYDRMFTNRKCRKAT